MRADRLLSMLMLLQARGRLTAEQLAAELEVSVRTIYRDLDALSAAGVPVYAERGPGGGCALLEEYRTTLTGLTPDEVRALFMLSIPAPLAELGLGPELKAALRKLAAALPAARRDDEARARQRFHLDPVGWAEAPEPVPHLRTLHRAVWGDRCLDLVYRLPFNARGEWSVEPYGLVAKAGTWHLVCRRDGVLRVLYVGRIVDTALGATTFQRPPDFDLAAFWADWCAAVEASRGSYPVTVRVAPQLVPWLPHYFGSAVSTAGIRDRLAAAPSSGDEWLTLTLTFESLEEARDRFLVFGGAVEVLAPRALRAAVADYAAQTVALYHET
ncbi:MAG: helix-turn-helix transcriptional regulator [Anaerolineae bacterium]